MSLTNAELKAKLGNTHDKRFVDLSDGNGLVARWFKTGKISWYLRYRWQGKQVAFHLGNYPTLTIKEARNKTMTCKGLLDQGIDPRADKKAKLENQAEEQEMTLRVALNYWFKEELPRRRKHVAQVIQPIEKHILPTIGDVPVIDLTPQHWMKAFKNMAHAPVLAGAVLINIKQALKYCRVTGFCRTDSLSDITVIDVGSMPKQRERVLTRKELREVWELCSDSSSPGNLKSKLLLLIIMVTGCRSGEIRQAKKTDFDFESMVWTVPKEISKNGRAIKRPIPERLVPFLHDAMALAPDSTLMFPSRINKDKPMIKVSVPRASKLLIEQLGQEHWTPHVLRHTISTTFGDLEIEPYIAEKMLGHTLGGVMAIYNKGHYLKQQADAMDIWIDYMSTDRVFDAYV